jgi:hypothetical protein
MKRGSGRRAGRPRLNQNSLLGALMRDPDDRGTGARSRTSHRHGGSGRKRQQRCHKPGDRSLVHSIFSIRTLLGAQPEFDTHTVGIVEPDVIRQASCHNLIPLCEIPLLSSWA